MIILVALAIIAIMNIASFALMGHDKRCARQGKWRVPEKRLFLEQRESLLNKLFNGAEE